MTLFRTLAMTLCCLSLLAVSTWAQSDKDAIEIQNRYQTGQTPGVQVTICLQQADGSLRPVEPEHEFRQGDRVKFKLESNFHGFLYIINHNASDKQQLIFPADKESNAIAPGTTYLLPRTYDLEFDEKAGFETLQVIAVVQRLPVFEAAINQPDGTLTQAQMDAAARFWRDLTPHQAGITAGEIAPPADDKDQSDSRNPAFDKKKKTTTVLSSLNKGSDKQGGKQNSSGQGAALGIKLKSAGSRR